MNIILLAVLKVLFQIIFLIFLQFLILGREYMEILVRQYPLLYLRLDSMIQE